MAKKRKRLREGRERLPLYRLFPNVITLLSLCSGLTAVKKALTGNFEHAVALIVLAAVLDALDGRFARLLNAQSPMGANLDSLCDFVNFGFCPAFIMYIWLLSGVPMFGWAAVLVSAICTAIRLARFNTQEGQRSSDSIKSRFFCGVPSPAGGILMLLPLALSFEFNISWATDLLSGKGIALYVIIVAILMASTIPTLSIKKIHISRGMITPVMIVAGGAIAFSFIQCWLAFVIASLLYITSIPLSWWRCCNMERRQDAQSPRISSP